MKIGLPLLALVTIVFLTGCDGHARILYLTPPQAATPPWSVAAVVIKIDGSEDVVGIVSDVAAAIAMQPAESELHHWMVATDDRNTFYLKASIKPCGYWQITLVDWPQIKRSKHSLQAENLIRAALKKDEPVAIDNPDSGL